MTPSFSVNPFFESRRQRTNANQPGGALAPSIQPERNQTMQITQIKIAYHRNGICGAPFHVALFCDGESHKLAILFDAKDHCAVLDITKLAAGDIAFGSNSWRGDEYEPLLRRAIAGPSPLTEDQP